MIKKLFLITLFIILLVFLYSLSTAAYFQPETYRSSLLEIRAAERSLNNLNEKLTAAEADFRIIADQRIESSQEELDELYQQLLQAYQTASDSKVEALAAEIIKKSEEILLQTTESKPVQMRAFWLDSGTLARTEGREGVEELLDSAAEANFNLIFPETFYKGISLIPDNELFTQDPRFKSWQEDPLQVLIEEAQVRNMEVHPWVWVFNENTSGSPGRILTKNPEWANINKDGEIVSYHNSSWLSPARDDVKEFLQQRYIYLVENYDLAGINLDYIRFPEEYRGSFGYDQVSVQKFKEKYKLDPFQIESGSSEFSLWNQYRENLVTEMVRETSEKLRRIDPNLFISADVIPGREEARYRALQNWSHWLREGYLDFVLPMTYTENLFSELSSWIEEDRKQISAPLYAGVSVFKLTPDQMINQIEEINQINPNGHSLFAAAHLTESDYQTLTQGVFSTPARLPHRNKKESLNLMQDFILKRLTIIKEADAINNQNLIKIRAYLNQKIKTDSKEIKDFSEFLKLNNINLSEKVKTILAADFAYLEDIIRLY
ncbi:MAG: glycoside hydrolase family 10 protein [Halanaerobium sp.]